MITFIVILILIVGVLGAGGVVSPTFAADILGTTSNGLSIDSLGRAFNQAGQFVQQLIRLACQSGLSGNARQVSQFIL